MKVYTLLETQTPKMTSYKGKTKTKNSMGTQKPLLNIFLTILRDSSVLTDNLFLIFLGVYKQSF